MKPLRHAPLVVAVLAAAALSWVLITRATEQAHWLRVEIPRQIVSGGRAQITLTLKAPLPAGFLGVDLHWRNARQESRGTLSTSRAQLLRAAQTEYRFDLAVPARPNLESIYAVIYVSPTQRWRDRTRACLSEPVAVSPKIDPAKTGQRRTIAAHDQLLGPPPPRQDSPAARWTSALCWLLAGTMCWRTHRLGRRGTSGLTSPLVTRWAWLALACFLAALWETSTAESTLGNWLRQIAMARGWYEGRRHLQEGLTAIVIAISLVGAVIAWRRDHAQPVSLVFSGADAYWCVAAVSFISLHDADAWLGTPVLTIPVVQILKLAAAFVAASGAVRAARSTPNP